MIGQGLSYEEASEKIGMVVEGYHALEAAMALSERYGVEMPITQAAYEVLYCGKSAVDELTRLMKRENISEVEGAEWAR